MFPYSFDLIFCPIQESIWLRGGDPHHLQVFKQEGWWWPPGTLPTFHLICFIVPYTNIYGLGVVKLTVYKFSNKRGWGDPLGTSLLFHFICFIAPYKNIYGLGVGIWTIYKIIAHSQIERGEGDPQELPFNFIWLVLSSHSRIYMV